MINPARSNDALALVLLADATADSAHAEGQALRDRLAEEARRQIALAAGRRSSGDMFAVMLAGLLAITVLAPFLIGHLLLTKTFVLQPDPHVYEEQVRGIGDHFFATYLAGLVPIVLLLGIFLVARTPWQGRTAAVAGGWIAVFGSLVLLLPIAQSKWHDAEQKTIAKLRETPFPFADRYYQCASWYIHAENGAKQPELWQVHLGQLQGSDVKGCNRVNVYRGWRFVGAYNLPDGDTFTGKVVINHVGLDQPFEDSGGTTVSAISRNTGESVPMNPVATNIDLATENGHRLQFSLDGAGADRFDLQ